MTEHRTQVLIIGSGPAGLTAGIYAARANRAPLIVSGMQLGGQLTTTSGIENYPGFEEEIGGLELMERMQKQAERVGSKILYDTITEADLSTRPFVCKGDSGDIYIADTLIIATGASPRKMDIAGEDKYRGFGVSYCATCDGFFYRGKDVCVIGGGNTAVEEALYLAGLANKVYLIHRRDAFRAEKVMQEKAFANPKIEMVLDSVPTEFIGTENPLGLTAVKVKNVKTEEERTIPAHGVFIAIGYRPNTSLFGEQIDTDEAGFIITKPNSTATNIDGVFSAGDVKNPLYRQAVIAAGSGCLAALEAEKFLSVNE